MDVPVLRKPLRSLASNQDKELSFSHLRLTVSAKSQGSAFRSVFMASFGIAILMAFILLSRTAGAKDTSQHTGSNNSTVFPGEHSEFSKFKVLQTDFQLIDLEPLMLNGTVPTLASLLSQLGAIKSGYNCSAAAASHRSEYIVCKFRYLAIWDGKVYFFHPDADTLELPVINVDWMLGGCIGIDKIQSLDALSLPQDTEIAYYKESALVFFTFYHNFYHVFAEYMPSVHNIACQWLGLCKYDPTSQFQLIMVDDFDIRPEHKENPVNQDFLRCLTNNPMRHVRSPQFDQKLVVLDTAVTGWGTQARADHNHIHYWTMRGPPPSNMMSLWRKRLADCLGFDIHKKAPQDPVNVVLINRNFQGGRSFLNVDQMLHLIQTRYPPAHVRIEYLDWFNLKDSARLFNNATVVIWQHGAAMANLIFLPEGASGIQIVMKDRPLELFGWPDELLRDYPNDVTLVHCTNTNPDRIVMRAEWVKPNDQYKGFTAAQKLAMWEGKQCPHNETVWDNHICEEFFFKIGSSLEVNLEQFQQALDLVMPKYIAKQSS